MQNLTTSVDSHPSAYLEETLLLDWLLETDPHALLPLCRFWLYHSFSLCPSSDLSLYHSQLSLLLRTLSSQVNLVLHSFPAWVALLQSLPLWNTELVLPHIRLVMSEVRTQPQVEWFFQGILSEGYSIKRENKEMVVRLIINEVVMLESDENRFNRYKLVINNYIY